MSYVVAVNWACSRRTGPAFWLSPQSRGSASLLAPNITVAGVTASPLPAGHLFRRLASVPHLPTEGQGLGPSGLGVILCYVKVTAVCHIGLSEDCRELIAGVTPNTWE